MSAIVELGAKRAAATSDPRKCKPRDLLLNLIAEIDNGKLDPTHMIVICGFTNSELQTSLVLNHVGPYDRFGQIGLMMDAVNMISNG